VIRLEHLPARMHGAARTHGAAGWSSPPWDFDGEGIDFYREMASIEDRIIARALDISRGNKKEAARLLRVNRTTLLEKLKRKREAALSQAAPAPEWAPLVDAASRTPERGSHVP
jgi:DNA-binding NtrC family response regulator